MSTQSSTPLTPKGPRNNRRNQKKVATPSAQDALTLATPPSSPPRTVSPREAATDSSGTITLSKKKGTRSAKKTRDVSKTSPVNQPGHHHISHLNNNNTTPQVKDTHYAGPTFHASPAPSALPIPSFFSKSFPDSDLAPTLEQDSDSFDIDADVEITPSKPKSRPLVPQGEREPTPLDFLFKAAVESRKCEPQRSPKPTSRVQSPQTDSKAIQRRKFDSDTNGMFPLEMGSSDLHHSQIGPSFAPSYKDRMNALRSASSPSPALQDLDEDERKAKTAALKSLLLNPPPQRPLSVSQTNYNQFNYNQERPVLSPMVPHFATPLRTSSGPPIISSHGDSSGKKPSHSGFWPHPRAHQTHFTSPQHHQPQDPSLGKGVLASNPGNTPSTPRQSYGSPSSVHPHAKLPTHQQSPACYPQLHSRSLVAQNLPVNANSPALDTKKMEDDIRRILKIDTNSGIPSSSIQSSLA
ncbi:hypothetical protein BDV12DRAFT_101688 [Aspergillus spectabilis]